MTNNHGFSFHSFSIMCHYSHIQINSPRAAAYQKIRVHVYVVDTIMAMPFLRKGEHESTRILRSVDIDVELLRVSWARWSDNREMPIQCVHPLDNNYSLQGRSLFWRLCFWLHHQRENPHYVSRNPFILSRFVMRSEDRANNPTHISTGVLSAATDLQAAQRPSVWMNSQRAPGGILLYVSQVTPVSYRFNHWVENNQRDLSHFLDSRIWPLQVFALCSRCNRIFSTEARQVTSLPPCWSPPSVCNFELCVYCETIHSTFVSASPA